MRRELRTCLLYAVLLIAASAADADADTDTGAAAEDLEQEVEELRPSLLLYKKVSPTEDLIINKPINVTLTIFNQGPGNAYQILVADDNWKADKFRIVAGANNFTLDFLNAGENYEHEFTVKPIRKMWHRVRPAKMMFVEFAEGDNYVTHLSNSLPEMRVVPKKDTLEENLLFAGRILTFNVIKTKQGWMVAAFIAMCVIGLQLHFIGSTVLQKRRHLRALEELKKQ